jgi:NAD(P)-dependent dehydrogenase (short-subunit alcohol dehydrogenase family)
VRSLDQLSNLESRRAFVTGAAGHIGSVVAETLVELGAKVVVSDIELPGCKATADSLDRKRKGSAIALACDLSNEEATRRTVKTAIQEMGGLDILVHSAAYVGSAQVPGWAVPFDEQTVSAWDKALRVNLASAFIMVQESRQAMEDSGHGSVIFFASTYGLIGPDHRLYENTSMANPAAYGVSKAGLLQLTRYLATTLAPRIRVNAISPGGVWRDQPETFRERYISRTPLRRMATEEDTKGTIAYLASDLSAYVTGQNLVIDGGWTAW